MRGIHNYTRTHDPWHLWIEERGEDELPRLPPGWAGDGIIAQVATPAMARYLAEINVPTVNISSARLQGIELPRVSKDLLASGQLAATHLMERGLRHFAYCALPRSYYIERHRDAFVEALATSGHDCQVYVGRRTKRAWRARQESITRWLEESPKPVGVFTWGIPSGRAVLDACRAAGLDVPSEVAVLAGDDDELTCEICHPPLSGMPFPSEQIGREAASLLASLMEGHPPPKKEIYVEPTGVVTRQSTDMLAVDDPDLLRAIRFIRDHCVDPIQVRDVVDAVAASRRSLEYRFHNLLGRTIAAEIRRVHVERAKLLLAQTDMPVPKVAAASGFGSPEYMSYIFKNKLGLTPVRYRANVRGG